jgi:hypothetical protein
MYHEQLRVGCLKSPYEVCLEHQLVAFRVKTIVGGFLLQLGVKPVVVER